MNEDRLIPYRASAGLDGERLLVLAPHPDDEVFGCGGTLHAMAARGVRVSVAVATDGELGGAGSDLRARRRAESAAAARTLGLPEPGFWALPDRGLLAEASLASRVADAVAQAGADLVLAPSWLEVHPDHRALCRAALTALSRPGNRVSLALYEIGRPLLPNLLVDITGSLAAKRRAMSVFESQLAERPYDRYVDALNRYRAYTLGAGVEAVEAFRVLAPAEVARYAEAFDALGGDGGESAALAWTAQAGESRLRADALRARADALQREADDARTALRAVLDSRWWRLGEPWRALRRRLRRPPG